MLASAELSGGWPLHDTAQEFEVYIEPGAHRLRVGADQNVLAAALAAGIALPHSCRAGRCASCKARLLAGSIAYPGDALPPGLVAAEAARGEVLLCQARPRSDLRIQSRMRLRADEAPGPVGVADVSVGEVSPLPAGGMRVELRFLGQAGLAVRGGQFVDAETASGERERAAVVAVMQGALHVELTGLEPAAIVRLRGPFDTPR